MSDILEVTRGDTEFLDITATEPDGSPVNLSASAIWWTAKYSRDHDDADAVFLKTRAGGGIVVTDAVNGVAYVRINPADWVLYRGTGVLVRDFQVVDPGSPATVITLAQGRVRVTQDVTRAIA